jgi:hypothetical protein
MGQALITRNPLILVPWGYGVGTMGVQLWQHYGPKGREPWEHRYDDAIAEGRIPQKVTLEEFRAKYDDYGHTPYNPDPKNE